MRGTLAGSLGNSGLMEYTFLLPASSISWSKTPVLLSVVASFLVPLEVLLLGVFRCVLLGVVPEDLYRLACLEGSTQAPQHYQL